MANVAEKSEREAIYEQLLAELRARPEGKPLTGEELMSFIRRAPKMPDGWTSADDIRDFRGPLPDDDPDCPTADDRHVSAVLQQILSRDPVNLDVPAADLVREGRGPLPNP